MRWLLSCLALTPAWLASLLSADAPPPVLPDSEYPRLVEFSIGVMADALKDKPDKRSADKARTAALMIAAYAQQNLSGPGGAQRATVRDAALEVAALIKAKEYPKAVKQAQALPGLKADPKAKKEKIRLLGAALDFDDLMAQFRQPPRGGLGIEGRFEALESNGGSEIPVKEVDEQLVRHAYLTAVAAELSAEHVPEEKDKAKEWKTYAADMRQHALALGKAARAKDGKAAFRALELLNRSCEKCHKVFR